MKDLICVAACYFKNNVTKNNLIIFEIATLLIIEWKLLNDYRGLFIRNDFI